MSEITSVQHRIYIGFAHDMYAIFIKQNDDQTIHEIRTNSGEIYIVIAYIDYYSPKKTSLKLFSSALANCGVTTDCSSTSINPHNNVYHSLVMPTSSENSYNYLINIILHVIKGVSFTVSLVGDTMNFVANYTLTTIDLEICKVYYAKYNITYDKPGTIILSEKITPFKINF